jgi:trehalose-6-phosphate synthase
MFYQIIVSLTQNINMFRKDPEVLRLVSLLKEKYAGRYVVIGRDKNDYVKGVRHKLLAFERFLENHPEMQGKVVLIQVSLSTSEANESQSNVSNVVSRINSQFGTIEYVPVVYLHQDISFNHYLALLTMADACLITSLRDGMNLTSHEYVVCQEEKKSPLIISEVLH